MPFQDSRYKDEESEDHYYEEEETENEPRPEEDDFADSDDVFFADSASDPVLNEAIHNSKVPSFSSWKGSEESYWKMLEEKEAQERRQAPKSTSSSAGRLMPTRTKRPGLPSSYTSSSSAVSKPTLQNKFTKPTPPVSKQSSISNSSSSSNSNTGAPTSSSSFSGFGSRPFKQPRTISKSNEDSTASSTAKTNSLFYSIKTDKQGAPAGFMVRILTFTFQHHRP